jgi:hypothetical protein
LREDNVSPNGRFFVVAFSGNESRLFVQDFQTGQDIKSLAIPGQLDDWTTAHYYSSPQTHIDSKYGLRDEYFPGAERASHIMFSANSEIMALSQGGSIRIWKTDSWEETATITPNFVEESGHVLDFKLQCFSQDGNLMACPLVRGTRTSQGEVMRRRVGIFDTSSGKRLQTVELHDGLSTDSRSPKKNDSYLTLVMFTADEKSLVTVTSIDRSSSQHASWTLASWNVSNGANQFAITSDKLDSTPEVVSPDGNILVLKTSAKDRRAIDVPHLVRIVTDLQHGDAFWNSGEHQKAFLLYCSVLSDELSWFISSEAPRLWSRCIDHYSEVGDVPSGRQIVDHAGSIKITLSPETERGKELLEQYAMERQESAQRLANEKQIARTEKLANFRAKNKQNYVTSQSLTKKQFLQKMRETLSHGRWDEYVTYLQFANYAFQDTFGEPDSNVAWIDGTRLITYRCQDGSIQLTVLYVENSVHVSNINEF